MIVEIDIDPAEYLTELYDDDSECMCPAHRRSIMTDDDVNWCRGYLEARKTKAKSA